MRIIRGSARGTKLYTLEGKNTRPTLDRVRESVFNIIQNEIKESTFVDLFSGSGAVGLEAASRGAKKVILCDKSKEATQIINKNIEKTHLQEKVKLYNTDFVSLIKNKINEKIHIIYIDPPYDSDYIYISIKEILEKEIIDENSIIIIETDQEERILKQIQELKIEIIDKRKYGRANIIFLKLKKETIGKG